MSEPTHDITYDLGRYTLLINGLYHSTHLTQVDAENAFDDWNYARLTAPLSIPMAIAKLAADAGKALSTGDRATYEALKARAMALKAQELGMEYSVFASEYSAREEERKAERIQEAARALLTERKAA